MRGSIETGRRPLFSVYFSPDWGMGKGQIAVKGLWGKALRGHGCWPSVARCPGDTWAGYGPVMGRCTRGCPDGASRAAPGVATTERDTRGALPCATRGLRAAPATRDTAQRPRGDPAVLRGVLRVSRAGSARSIAAQRRAHPACPRRFNAARPSRGPLAASPAPLRPLSHSARVAPPAPLAPKLRLAVRRGKPRLPRALRGRGRPGGREATAVRRRRAERSR